MSTSSSGLTFSGLRNFGIVVALSVLATGRGWLRLLEGATGDELHSYALVIPVICGWLVWTGRAETAGLRRAPSWPLAGMLGGAALLAWAGAWSRGGVYPDGASGRLTLEMLGWVLAVWAAGAACLGGPMLRRQLFPWAFLIFTVPLPPVAVNAIEIGLQNASAWGVDLALRAFRVTFLRDERSFWLPGLRFVVAQECSGIRSTVVLVITSLLGGYLLLRTGWRRGVFALCVVPLGIARNVFRICTLAFLAIHVDPRILDSPLHHRGGPLFFLVSLVPLFLLLGWFRRQEARGAAAGGSPPKGASVAAPAPPAGVDSR